MPKPLFLCQTKEEGFHSCFYHWLTPTEWQSCGNGEPQQHTARHTPGGQLCLPWSTDGSVAVLPHLHHYPCLGLRNKVTCTLCHCCNIAIIAILQSTSPLFLVIFFALKYLFQHPYFINKQTKKDLTLPFIWNSQFEKEKVQ